MQIHQLECFITVVKYKSFSGAASELYMTAPGVTKQINALEQYLGFRLFKRDNKGVQLTEAGKVFYADAVKLVNFANDAVRRVRKLAKAAQQRLVLGVVLPSRQMTAICNAYREQSACPATLHYKQITTAAALKTLMDHEIDLYIQLGRPPLQSDIRSEILCHSKLQCILNVEHPLNAKNRILLSDLNGETLVLPPEGQLEYFDRFRGFLRENYPEIHLITQENAVSTYMAIEINQAFSVTALIRGLDNPMLCYRPIDTAPWDQRIEICLVYRAEKNPCLEEFVQIAQDCFRYVPGS